MKSSKLAERRPIPRLGLSRAELAISIGVSAGSIDQMVAEGVLPPPRIWHTRKIWLLSDVEAYLNEWPADGQAPRSSSVDWLERLDQPHAAPSRPTPDPLQEHYDHIGFDPKTMGNEDYRRLHAEAHARWIAEIPSLPLNKLEMRSLKQLEQHGAGAFVASNKIKGCGPDTQERLAARGFIVSKFRDGEPDRHEGYILTEKGLAFIKAL